jgi:pimeloyl-ACP methyl ester carboxylesterase
MILGGVALSIVVLLVGEVAMYGSSEVTRIPYLAVPYTPKDLSLAYEDVTFQSFDNLKLTGWFLPAKVPTDVTLMILHGLGSNAGDMLLNSLALAKAGRWNLCLFNFRGHADSEGHYTSLGPLELKDFESAMAYVKKTRPEASRRLAVYGHSLGASVAIVAAARHPELLAVVAESPFVSTRKTVAYFAKKFYGIPDFPFMQLALLLTRFRLGISLWNFSPLDDVGKIAPRPFFMIHAERDQRMPMSDTEALFAAAGEPKEIWIAPGADHGEPWMVAKEEYDKRMVEFFRKVFP